jgi:hypothetical protein
MVGFPQQIAAGERVRAQGWRLHVLGSGRLSTGTSFSPVGGICARVHHTVVAARVRLRVRRPQC